MEIKHIFNKLSIKQLTGKIKYLRNKLYLNRTQNILKNLNIKKIAAINFSFILFNYFLLKNKKVYNSKNDFDYLINFNIKDKEFLEKFKKKKVPKILYLKSFCESENDKTQIESNFQKIHTKYKELDSYVFDIRKNLTSVYELQNLLKEYGHSLSDIIDENFKFDLTNENLGEIKEELLKKPFLFLNKYGDVRNYKLEEFNEIAKSDAVYNYFEKLSILNNKNDLLVLNEYDYAFVIYLDSKNLDYNKLIFRIFRRMHFVINFFNIKFFVATPEHSSFLSSMNLELNNAYILKRHNLLGKNHNSILKEFENENFEIINLTKDIINLKPNQDDNKFSLQLIKTLMQKTNFVYYSNHQFKTKQGLEILNLYFRDVPYYLLFTNLKIEKNREKLNEIISIFKENIGAEKIQENFAFVVVDNEKINETVLFKLFKQKTFNLADYPLKNTKFEDKIPHYEPTVTKKLRITSINNETLSNLINTGDIDLKNNYLFIKKVLPENLKNINYIQFDYMTKSNKTKIILVKNKDEKYNRNAIDKLEELAKENPNVEFFHMFNTEKNIEFLNKKYNNRELVEIKNYPQLLILKDDKLSVFPEKIFLKYSLSYQDLNRELSKNLL